MDEYKNEELSKFSFKDSKTEENKTNLILDEEMLSKIDLHLSNLWDINEVNEKKAMYDFLQTSQITYDDIWN